MSMNIKPENRRLLEALDYIEDGVISSVLAEIKVPAEGAPEGDRRSFGRSIRYALALAACLVLMSAVIPVVSYLTEKFSAGSQPGYDFTYPMFVADLEPLSDEEMAKINEVYDAHKYELLYNKYYEFYVANGSLTTPEKMAAESAREQLGNNIHRFFNEEYYRLYQYYGKFGDCVVLAVENYLLVEQTLTVAGHSFKLKGTGELIVYIDGEMMSLGQAFEAGHLTESQIGKAYERHLAYRDYLNESVAEPTVPDTDDIPEELKIDDFSYYSPPPVELSDEEKRRIVWDYISDKDIPNKFEYSYGVRCYGKYNGAYAVMIDGPWFHATALRSVDVAGYKFLFPDSQRMYIYKDGAFYTLREAYNSGVVSKDYIASIVWNKAK